MNSDQLINTKKLFIPTAQTSHGLKKIMVHESKIWNAL